MTRPQGFVGLALLVICLHCGAEVSDASSAGSGSTHGGASNSATGGTAADGSTQGSSQGGRAGGGGAACTASPAGTAVAPGVGASAGWDIACEQSWTGCPDGNDYAMRCRGTTESGTDCECYENDSLVHTFNAQGICDFLPNLDMLAAANEQCGWNIRL